MIEEEFELRECYIDEQSALQAQYHLLWKFNLFCERMDQNRITLESATIKRGIVLGIHCIKVEGKVSGRAEDVAAMMLAGTIA